MTIIKVSKDGKAIIKKKEEEAFVPLADVDSEPEARVIHIETMPAPRTRRLVNIFLLLIALMVLSAGIIGGVFFYKYMAHRHNHKMSRVAVQYWCGVQDTPQHSEYLTMEEDIEVVQEEELERIEVPDFEECKKAVVIHNFLRNVTVIIDNEDGECFVMDLDQTHLTPPRTILELVQKYVSGYYMPKVDVVRRDYQVVTPPLKDMSFTGPTIELECLGYNSYRLVKKQPIKETFFELEFKFTKTYGYSDLKTMIKDRIYK